MRVFVCEFVTGGGFQGRPVPPGLRTEGDLMLAALVKDLAGVPGVEVTIARDGRLSDPGLPAEIVSLGADGDPWRLWMRLIDETEAVWPVAPETDAALERLSRLALDRRRILLGSRPDAVRVAASKLATARLLQSCGVPTVPTWRADAAPVGREAAGLWVLKPDDGAGCDETLLLERLDAVSRHVPVAGLHRIVVQPFVPGEPASLSLLCRDGEAALLSCNRQHVSCDGGVFKYAGGIVGGMEHRRADFEPIAAAVARSLPGLWGYVGIDLVDGPDGPVVMDLNPRLTTSYAGLHDAMGCNPAALVMELLAGAPMTDTQAAARPVTIDLGAHHG